MVTYELSESARLGWDTILQKPTRGIPSWLIHIMEHSQIERLAGAKPGDYERDPENTYIAFQRAIGTCMLDQYIPDNPLTMGDQGFEGTEKGATTGAEEIVLDGLRISSPEAVVGHLEQVAFPQIQKAIATFDEAQRIKEILDYEAYVQARLGPGILKVPYGVVSFPIFPYHLYGYRNYFSAYALYPEVMERHFSLQAELAVLQNRASARAYVEGKLPPLCRTDHDIADSRGTLMSLESLDRLWLPHFARSLEPVLRAGVRLIWHCDGNLMPMIPRLLEAGIRASRGSSMRTAWTMSASAG